LANFKLAREKRGRERWNNRKRLTYRDKLQRIPGLSRPQERTVLQELRTFDTKRLFKEAKVCRKSAERLEQEGKPHAANLYRKISDIFYQRAYGKKNQSAFLERKKRR